jgi:hypothetical protein
MTASAPNDQADYVLVLTESALTPADVQHLLDIYRDPDGDGQPDPVAFRVFVPEAGRQHFLTRLLDHLGMADLAGAWADIIGKDKDEVAVAFEAASVRDQSVAALSATGIPTTGEVITGDPPAQLEAAVAAGNVREIAVFTWPHPVEDTFHLDWATRARERLSVPVLHLYTGTSELG